MNTTRTAAECWLTLTVAASDVTNLLRTEIVSTARTLQPVSIFLARKEAKYRGQKTEVRGQKTEGRGQRAEDRGQRTEGRGQKTEGRGQRAEGRGQRTEDRGQRSEDRGQKTGMLTI
jgi:hypothetical protein